MVCGKETILPPITFFFLQLLPLVPKSFFSEMFCDSCAQSHPSHSYLPPHKTHKHCQMCVCVCVCACVCVCVCVSPAHTKTLAEATEIAVDCEQKDNSHCCCVGVTQLSFIVPTLCDSLGKTGLREKPLQSAETSGCLIVCPRTCVISPTRGFELTLVSHTAPAGRLLRTVSISIIRSGNEIKSKVSLSWKFISGKSTFQMLQVKQSANLMHLVQSSSASHHCSRDVLLHQGEDSLSAPKNQTKREMHSFACWQYFQTHLTWQKQDEKMALVRTILVWLSIQWKFVTLERTLCYPWIWKAIYMVRFPMTETEPGCARPLSWLHLWQLVQLWLPGSWHQTPPLIYSICELLLVFTWTIEDSDLNYVGLKHIYRGLFTFLQSSMPWQNISLTFLSFVSWHLVMVPPLVMQHSSTNPLASDRPTRSICSSGRSMDIIQHFHHQNKSRISWLCSNKQFAISAARSVFIRLTQMMFAWEGMGGAAAICRANLHSRV